MDPPADPGYEPMPDRIAPMLARSGELPPRRAELGLRGQVGRHPHGRLPRPRAHHASRAATSPTSRRAIPEVRELARELGARRVILDGEVVAFDEQGRPSFERLQSRMHLASDSAVRRRMQDTPGHLRDLRPALPRRPLDDAAAYEQRRELLEALELDGPAWRAPAYHRGEGSALLEATRELGIEGIVAKRLDSPYEPGRRSSAWLKVKNVCEQDVVIGGWTPGEGGRSSTLRRARGRRHRRRQARLRRQGRHRLHREDARAAAARARAAARATSSPFDGRQPPKGTSSSSRAWSPRRVARMDAHRNAESALLQGSKRRQGPAGLRA